MLDSICDSIVDALTSAGINAVRKFPSQKLERNEQIVCVSLKSAVITASGLGNYIGFCWEDGVLKEMYGSKAELKMSLEIFSPTPDCGELRDSLSGQLGSITSMSVKSFEAGEVSFDSRSGMFRCECLAEASCCLVRSLVDSNLSGYGIEGEAL